MNVTIKDLSPLLHRKLKERAVANKRSRNWEVTDILETAVAPKPLNVAALIKEVDAIHGRIQVTPLNQAILRRAKNEGRL